MIILDYPITIYSTQDPSNYYNTETFYVCCGVLDVEQLPTIVSDISYYLDEKKVPMHARNWFCKPPAILPAPHVNLYVVMERTMERAMYD